MICHLIPLALGGAGGCARKVWLRSSNLFDPGRERWPRQHPHTHQDSQPRRRQPRPQTSLSPVHSRDAPQTRNGGRAPESNGTAGQHQGFPHDMPTPHPRPSTARRRRGIPPSAHGEGGQRWGGGDLQFLSQHQVLLGCWILGCSSTKSCSAVGYRGVLAGAPPGQ